MTMASLQGSPLLESVGWALVHFLWQATAVGVAFWASRGLMRRASANARYVAGCVALVALMAMPVATVLRLSAIPSGAGAASVATEESDSGAGGDSGSAAGAAGASRPSGLSTRNPFRPLAEATGDAGVAGSAEAVGLRLESWLPWILALWALGAAAMSARLLAGWMYLRRLKNTLVHPIPLEWQRRFEGIRLTLGVRRAVLFLESVRIRVPCVVGWIRPAVLLPLSALTGLSPSQLEAVVAHELAHIRRHDYLVNWLQSLVETLLFYHPVVWWVSRCARDEREHCCDDLAVAVCGDRAEYVRTLVALEEARGTVARLAAAATGGSLLHRARRLLLPGETFPVRPPGWVTATAVLSVVACLFLLPRTEREANAVASVSVDAKPAVPAPVSSLSLPDSDDVADVAARDLLVDNNPNQRYALIGGVATAPKDGYRLLIVLPGGDGGLDFHPFIKRIYKNALSDRYLVAQLIAPKWLPDQFERVVWPTERSPWPGMEFSTEAFIEAVARDVKSRFPVDERYVFGFGWSSGGPPVYAESLKSDSAIAGSFIAMSAFTPAELPPLENARGHAYFLLYSPDDFIPAAMPEAARDQLRANGAQVKTLTYPGGHGWRGDVYGNIRAGVEWLESTRNPFRETTER